MTATFRPQIENLESREMLAADWFSTYIANPAIANMARADWNNHGSVNYNDMLAIYSQVERTGPVNASEFASLQFLGKYGYLLNTPAPTNYLENQVVGNNVANRTYLGYGLGNLGVNSPSWQLQELVGKWFLGTDHPGEAAGETYRAYGGSIFGSGGPSYADVSQGQTGDCALLASFAEVAAKAPSVIQGMFTNNGNNTFTVRFYENGSPVYVTVDNLLPSNANGTWYDHPLNNVLWAALAEKAYAEVNAFDNQDGVSTQWTNSYTTLNGLWTPNVLNTLTGRTGYLADNSATDTQALKYGNLVVVGTGSSTGNVNIVADHAYAVIGYNASTGMYTLYNPWGIQQAAANHVWGLFYANQAWIDTYCTDAGGYTYTAPTAGVDGLGLTLSELQPHKSMFATGHAVADAAFATLA